MDRNNNPFISVIIPIYNVEKFLPQCLDSVMNQTYRNLEIILVNDGSPDNSDAICKEYLNRDFRFKYVTQENAGLSSARNFGLRIATGEYIFFLDSDDYLSVNCIQSLVEEVQGNVLPVIGYELDFSDNGTIISPSQHYGTYVDVHDFFFDFHKYFATKSNFVWGKLYQAKVIRDNKLTFPEGISLTEDILFNLEYYRLCDSGVAMISNNGYYYRQHGSSTLSKKFNPKMFDWNELAYKAVRDFLIEYDAMTEQNKRHIYNNILGNLLYSTELLCFAKEIPFKRKMELVKHYTSTQLAKETFMNVGNLSFRSRLESELMKNCPFVYFHYNHFVMIGRKIKKKMK